MQFSHGAIFTLTTEYMSCTTITVQVVAQTHICINRNMSQPMNCSTCPILLSFPPPVTKKVSVTDNKNLSEKKIFRHRSKFLSQKNSVTETSFNHKKVSLKKQVSVTATSLVLMLGLFN